MLVIGLLMLKAKTRYFSQHLSEATFRDDFHVAMALGSHFLRGHVEDAWSASKETDACMQPDPRGEAPFKDAQSCSSLFAS